MINSNTTVTKKKLQTYASAEKMFDFIIEGNDFHGNLVITS